MKLGFLLCSTLKHMWHVVKISVICDTTNIYSYESRSYRTSKKQLFIKGWSAETCLIIIIINFLYMLGHIDFLLYEYAVLKHVTRSYPWSFNSLKKVVFTWAWILISAGLFVTSQIDHSIG